MLLAGCTSHVDGTPSGPSTGPAAVAPSGASGALQHVVVIVDENKPATNIIGNAQAPYLNALASQYARASRYSAITHPSLPNYLALTSGTTGGITSDCPPGGSCLVTSPNLADSLAKAGLTWKMYAEGMPRACDPNNSGDYAVKHNPFLYYPSVTHDTAACAQHVVPFTQFAADLASASALPAFSFVSPNLCNDMHDCSVATGDAWLAREVPAILASPAFTAQRSLLVVTFDEGDSSDNVVDCVFAGPAAKRGFVSSRPYTHYSLLRTIENGFGLPALTGDDAAATSMSDLLR
jgi:phospholipase C